MKRKERPGTLFAQEIYSKYLDHEVRVLFRSLLLACLDASTGSDSVERLDSDCVADDIISHQQRPKSFAVSSKAAITIIREQQTCAWRFYGCRV